MATTINPSDQTITQYNIQTGGASNLLNNVAPSATSGVAVISQGASSQPVFGTVVVAGGGTGAVTLTGVLTGNGTSAVTASTVTQHGVLVGGASNAVGSTGVGSTGQILQANTSADPTYSTATYPSIAGTSGKVLISDGTNIISSTPTFPNASATSGKFIQSDGTNWIASTPTIPATAGTSGKVLISDGTNFISSTPTFPNASATTRKIIVSDGTNWVASTETYAVPSTSGNVMTSDGTNWTSAAASSGLSLLSVTGTLTNAQLKAINSTPITVISTPGAGKIAVPLTNYCIFNYGGTNAFTGVNSLVIQYTGGAIIQQVLFGADMTGTASVNRITPNSGATGTIVNTAIQFTASANYAGNAANNNTVTYTLFYYIVTP